MSTLMKEKPMRTYIHGIAQTYAGPLFLTALLVAFDQESGRVKFKVLGVSNPEFQWQVGNVFEYQLLSWDFYTM